MKTETPKPETSKFSGALARLKHSAPATIDNTATIDDKAGEETATTDETTNEATVTTPAPTRPTQSSSARESAPRSNTKRVPEGKTTSSTLPTSSLPSSSLVPTLEAVAPLEAAKRGRPTGKRSDPDFEPTTVLLRKRTKRLANRKLEDTETKQDLSDLIEQLLTEWIAG